MSKVTGFIIKRVANMMLREALKTKATSSASIAKLVILLLTIRPVRLDVGDVSAKTVGYPHG